MEHHLDPGRTVYLYQNVYFFEELERGQNSRLKQTITWQLIMGYSTVK